jgi:NAD(P)-dependent dehydrogenase (short-subunit alcohol dehydrogenase family)
VRTVEAFDKIHVLCNNAGVALSGNISDMSYKDWDWVMNVNLHGVINGVVSFIDHIKSHDEGGHIVNTSSIAGQFGMAGLSIYSTTKFAVVGMSEAMRVDLAPFNIGTSVLCPGGVATNILTSERNRPDSLRGENTHSYQSGPVVQAANDGEQRRPQMSGVLPPDTIGDMVLDAIQNDVFYILSHPQFKDTIAQRGQELSDAADRWHAYLQQHSG